MVNEQGSSGSEGDPGDVIEDLKDAAHKLWTAAAATPNVWGEGFRSTVHAFMNAASRSPSVSAGPSRSSSRGSADERPLTPQRPVKKTRAWQLSPEAQQHAQLLLQMDRERSSSLPALDLTSALAKDAVHHQQNAHRSRVHALRSRRKQSSTDKSTDHRSDSNPSRRPSTVPSEAPAPSGDNGSRSS